MKRLALSAAVVLLTCAALYVSWELRSVFLIFFGSLVISATVDGPMDWLVTRGWPRKTAVSLLYLVAVGGLAILTTLLFVPVLTEIDPLLKSLTGFYGQVQAQLLGQATSERNWIYRLPSTEVLAAAMAGGEATTMVQNIFGITQNLGRLLTECMLALVLSVYWSVDSSRFERLWLSLLMPEQRAKTRAFWRRLQHDTGAYVRSETIQTILAITLFATGYSLLGISYPFSLAMIAGLAWLIPLIGGALALLPVLLIAWMVGPSVAIMAVLYTVLIFLFLEFLVQPRLHTGGQYWGVLLVLVMLVTSSLWGVLGLLVAPPLALVLQLGINELLSTPGSRPLAPRDLAALQERLQQVRGQLGTAREPSLRLAALAERLEQLMQEVHREDTANGRGKDRDEAEVAEGIALGPVEDHL
jgi:putative permease